MPLKAKLEREWRFLSGLNRTLSRVKSIAPDSANLLCDDLQAAVEKWRDRTAMVFEGRTVTYGSVLILGSDKKTRFGVIQPDGSYTVEGVTPGAVKIGVISRDPAKPASKVPASARATPTWFPLPPKFEDPATSGIVGTVGSGRVKHDIDLPAGDGS